MAWTDLKNAIISVIKENHNKEITGDVLQNVLVNIINDLGENATFAGMATPATNPGTPDGPVYYFAIEPGVYSNFNGIEVVSPVILEFDSEEEQWTSLILGLSSSEENRQIRLETTGIIPEMTQGSLSTQTGAPSPRSDRIRTSSFITVDGFKSQVGTGFKQSIYFYDLNESYLDFTGWVGDINYQNSYFKGKIKIVVAWDNDVLPIDVNENVGLKIRSGSDLVNSTFVENVKKDLTRVLSSSDLEWEKGSLSGSTGGPLVYDNIIRTSDYIPVDGYSLELSPNYRYHIFHYDRDKTFVSRITSEWTPGGGAKFVSDFRGYVKIVITWNPSNPGLPFPITENTGMVFEKMDPFFELLEQEGGNSDAILTPIKLSPSDWEPGSIKGGDGSNLDEDSSGTFDYILRSKKLIPVKGYSFTIVDGFAFHIFHYNKGGVYQGRVTKDWFYSELISDFEGYIRFAFKLHPTTDKAPLPVETDPGIEFGTGTPLKKIVGLLENKSPENSTRYLRGGVDIFAHRGVWVENIAPENTIHSLLMAHRFGFKVVECDVKKTKDDVLVIMHDATINRTMKFASDNSTIEDPVSVEDENYLDLYENYRYDSPVEKYRTPITLLEDFLKVCRILDIFPMLHSNIPESYDLAQKILGNNWCAFTGSVSALCYARSISQCLCLYSNTSSTDDVVPVLEQIGGWVGFSTTRMDFLSSHFIYELRQKGWEVQSSIPDVVESVENFKDGVTSILSDYVINLDDTNPQTIIYDNNTFDSFDTSGSISEGRAVLETDEILEFEGDSSVSYGGIDVRFRFTGKISIQINSQVYSEFESDGSEWLRISRRFAFKTPKFVIKAIDHTKVENIILKIQSF